MFGTRQLLTIADDLAQEDSDYINNIFESTPGKYLQDLLIKTKKISQVISYIWLHDDETSLELDKRFKDPKKLRKLLLAHEDDHVDPTKPNEDYELLKKVFSTYNHDDALPIFDKSDRAIYDFKLIFNQYEGYLGDAPNIETSKKLITMAIPYPPRPQIYDDISHKQPDPPLSKNDPLRASTLEKWLKDAPDKAPFYDRDNPYIPSTCC